MTSPSTLTRPQFEQASKALIAKYAHSSLSLDASRLKGWSWVEHPVCTPLKRRHVTLVLTMFSDSPRAGLLVSHYHDTGSRSKWGR